MTAGYGIDRDVMVAIYPIDLDTKNNNTSLPVISIPKSAHNQVELTNYIGGSLVSIRKVNQYEQVSRSSIKNSDCSLGVIK